LMGAICFFIYKKRRKKKWSKAKKSESLFPHQPQRLSTNLIFSVSFQFKYK
jgi:hypothetical protein